MKVLIVDGSKQKRRDLVELLGELTNVIVQGAVPDLRSAMQALTEVTPDVLVSGVVLPDGDSIQLLERVRRLANIPRIVIVANPGSDEQKERYLSAGADQYVTADELAPAVTRLARGTGPNAIAADDSQRLLGRMTAGVVHDLNNYLNVVEVAVRLLRRDPADADALWRQLRQALDAIARLTANLMTYARGGFSPPETLDLGGITKDVLQLIGRIVPPTVEVIVETDDMRPIRGVRPEIEQLVLNLVINAIDAMPDGGELNVSVRYRTSAAVLTVADTGRGRFAESAELGVSTKRRGRGLGLGIVRGVVERHRGALRITERDTGGTLVTVMLPISRIAR